MTKYDEINRKLKLKLEEYKIERSEILLISHLNISKRFLINVYFIEKNGIHVIDFEIDKININNKHIFYINKKYKTKNFYIRNKQSFTSLMVYGCEFIDTKYHYIYSTEFYKLDNRKINLKIIDKL